MLTYAIQVLDDGGDEYSDAEHWLNSYSSMDLDTYNNRYV